MAKTKTATKKGGQKTKPSSQAADNLRKLMEDQLKDMYWAEKALTKALPKMAKNASSEELVNAINEHLEITKDQVVKLEAIFEELGKKPQAKKCEAMEGLIKEGESIIEDTEPGAVRDAGIIGAAQKVEHYEIASYGTLASFASLLGEDAVAQMLEEILAEEKEADELLTEVAEGSINLEAMEGDSGEEEEEDDEEAVTASSNGRSKGRSK
jgi:ferritin-like metal-binding protein YciE